MGAGTGPGAGGRVRQRWAASHRAVPLPHRANVATAGRSRGSGRRRQPYSSAAGTSRGDRLPRRTVERQGLALRPARSHARPRPPVEHDRPHAIRCRTRTCRGGPGGPPYYFGRGVARGTGRTSEVCGQCGSSDDAVPGTEAVNPAARVWLTRPDRSPPHGRRVRPRNASAPPLDRHAVVGREPSGPTFPAGRPDGSGGEWDSRG